MCHGGESKATMLLQKASHGGIAFGANGEIAGMVGIGDCSRACEQIRAHDPVGLIASERHIGRRRRHHLKRISLAQQGKRVRACCLHGSCCELSDSSLDARYRWR